MEELNVKLGTELFVLNLDIIQCCREFKLKPGLRSMRAGRGESRRRRE